MPIYLGFDASTQSLSAIALRVDGATREIVCAHTLSYDEALPHYGTRHGVLPSGDPRVAAGSPLMWAEALDLMLGRLAADSRLDLAQVRAVSGSGQQHGSVYLAAGALDTLARLDPAQPLAGQIGGIFARAVAPIWMDASTGPQCAALAAALGGAEAVARRTGSRPTERFTGPQIRKFASTDPDGYARTAHVHLVSSFHATLLAGRQAPVDPGDGAGTNLMDLETTDWWPAAVRATAPGLGPRLPPVAPSWSIVGPLSGYWQARHGLPPAHVVAWSGDNPCSLVGTGLVREGRVAVSLGTSDTIFGAMDAPRVDPIGTGHVFGAPMGSFMGLTCFSNGSLARDRVRRERGLDWGGFADALQQAPAGSGGGILLPWFVPEITPVVREPGARAYGVDLDDAGRHVRALVEGQFVAMARHSSWMGVPIETIHATGGAAANRALLQVLADVFDARVLRFEVGNSACLGAALRAFHADARASGHDLSWDEVIEGFVAPIAEPAIVPGPARVARYAALRDVHAACEAHALGSGPDPAPAIERWRRTFPGEDSNDAVAVSFER
jgi:xylulokinase